MQTITESEFHRDVDGALHRLIASGTIAKLARVPSEDVLLIPTSIWNALLAHIDSAVTAAEMGPRS